MLVKLAYLHDVDATSLLMLRMLISLPFFIGLLIYFGRNDSNSFAQLKRHKWSIMLLGLMGYYIASLLDLVGLQYIDASLERIIIFIYPTFVIILSYLFLGQKAKFSQLIAILLAYLGIMIAFYGNMAINQGQQLALGGTFVIGSAFFYSIYLVGSQAIITKINSRVYNAAAMITACIAILVHNAVINGFNLLEFSMWVYIYAFLMAILATVLPSFLIVEGIKIIGANNSSIIGTIGPVATIVLATLLLGEHLNSTQIIGSALVIGGVLYLVMHKTKKT